MSNTPVTLTQAAKAVLDRWDSPQWEWVKQGPTADLMTDLRKAMDAQKQKERLVHAVIDAARNAVDESFADDWDGVVIPSHLAAALSLALDDYDRVQ